MRPAGSVVTPCPRAWFHTWNSECDLKRTELLSYDSHMGQALSISRHLRQLLLFCYKDRVPGTVVHQANATTLEDQGALGWEDRRIQASLDYTVAK